MPQSLRQPLRDARGARVVGVLTLAALAFALAGSAFAIHAAKPSLRGDRLPRSTGSVDQQQQQQQQRLLFSQQRQLAGGGRHWRRHGGVRLRRVVRTVGDTTSDGGEPEFCSIDAPHLCRGQGEIALVDRLNALLESGLGTGLLVCAAVVSMVLANLPAFQTPWVGFWKQAAGPRLGAHALTIKDWVNEGFMALFFFTVGLEIKKEMTEGSLASVDKAILPCIAAVGGMVVPVAIYLAVNTVLPGGNFDGAFVPMATDIAFAMGVYQAFRRHMPPASSSFLLTLATADDLGAIAVIALVFASSINPSFLAAAAVALLSAVLYGNQRFETANGLFIPGLLLWYCLLRGGINADIAGVLIAFCVPMTSKKGSYVVERLINRWSAASALIVLPIFALANCAVSFSGGSAASLAAPFGICAGLLVGKPLGVFLSTYIAVKLKVASMPTGMTKRHLLTVGVLASIGFTMCLFLIENSLAGAAAQTSKLAVFLSSVLAAGMGSMLMSQQRRTGVESGELAMS
eukprot:TRINITY_DN9731_c0_g1_i1.p1 TRINITY_DN9731_c0_g1~~TRINITY_DN9731_c0_g1_i1.p1  ORF type:complete len:523 (+),score=81.99 TRINITY_DN9731_c0_g1_i1:23-1570(+)